MCNIWILYLSCLLMEFNLFNWMQVLGSNFKACLFIVFEVLGACNFGYRNAIYISFVLRSKLERNLLWSLGFFFQYFSYVITFSASFLILISLYFSMISFSFSTGLLDVEISALFCFWMISSLEDDDRGVFLCIWCRYIIPDKYFVSIPIVSSYFITRLRFVFFLYISLNLLTDVASIQYEPFSLDLFKFISCGSRVSRM